MFKLVAPFEPQGDQIAAIAQLAEGVRSGRRFQTLLGVTGSGKTFTIANLICQLQKKTLILAPNKTLAGQLYSEFKEFFPENAVEYFVSYYDYYRPEAYLPATDVYIEKDSAINDEIDKLRHSTTRSLIERNDVIVVASVSCIYSLGEPEEYKGHQITLFRGQSYPRQPLLYQLIDNQFVRNDYDFLRGTYRVRGDCIDIFPPYSDDEAIRLEFFDEELEGISLIDPLKGTVKRSLNKVTIFPSSHYVVTQEKMDRAIKLILAELSERLAQLQDENKLVEKQRLEQRTLLDIEMMEQMGVCPGIENYARHMTGVAPGQAPFTLLDFFGNDFLFVIDESHVALPQLRGMFRGDYARKKNLVDYGFRLPSALDNRPLKFEEIEQKVQDVIFVSATPGDYEIERSGGEVVEQIIRPTGLIDPVVEIRDATSQVDDFLFLMKETIARKERVLILCLTKKMAEDLQRYYRGLGINLEYLHSEIDTVERLQILQRLRGGEIDAVVGINLLREGLDLPEVSLIGIFDADREGYLRSTRSLIQIIGRAARHIQGRVILYGHRVTPSMQSSVEETNRRRQIQIAHNEKHKITPQTVQRGLKRGILEQMQAQVQATHVDEVLPDEGRGLDELITRLSRQMEQAARNLRFEDAAQLRDRIKKLKEARLLI